MVILVPYPISLKSIKPKFSSFQNIPSSLRLMNIKSCSSQNSNRCFQRAFNHIYSIILSQDLRKDSILCMNAHIWLFRSQIPKINKTQILFISERGTLNDASNVPSTTFIALFYVKICVEKAFQTWMSNYGIWGDSLLRSIKVKFCLFQKKEL